MQGEREHPLRDDPLQALPDAVSLPPPRPVSGPSASSASSSSTRSSLSSRSPPSRSPPSTPPDPFPSAVHHPAFQQTARALLSSASTSASKWDPLLAAMAEHAHPHSRTPPAATRPHATDIHLAQSDSQSDHHHAQSSYQPVAAGLVHTSHITLLPAPSLRGSAAGVYLVRSQPSPAPSSQPPAEHSTVRRSVADFTWLEDRLRARYDAVIIPSLPRMAVLGRLTYGYAYDAERMRGLETFLTRVATHAVLSTADEVLAFLGATGEHAWRTIRREPITHESAITSALFRSRPDENPVAKLAHWTEKIAWLTARRVNNTVEWFLDRDSNTQRATHDSAEARLERLHFYVQQLGPTLSTVRHHAEHLANNRVQQVRNVAGMQAALRGLGHREGGQFGAMLKEVVLEIPADTSPNANTVTSSETTCTNATLPPARVLDDVLRDYEDRAQGAQRIMNARREEQDAYEHARETYIRLRNKLESRTGSMWEHTAHASKEGLEELTNSVSVASARLTDVRNRYQAVAISTSDELRRLRTSMHHDISDALRRVASDHARQHAAQARAWASLADAFTIDDHAVPNRGTAH